MLKVCQLREINILIYDIIKRQKKGLITLKKIFFTISILFSIIFMIYSIIEVFDINSPTPSALFYILMPTLLIGYAYHDAVIYGRVKKLIFITNTTVFIGITIVVLSVLMTGNFTPEDFGLSGINDALILYLGLYLFMLIYMVVVFSLVIKTLGVYPKGIKELQIVAFVILVSSLFLYGNSNVLDFLVVLSLVIIQGMNIYILIKDV